MVQSLNKNCSFSRIMLVLLLLLYCVVVVNSFSITAADHLSILQRSINRCESGVRLFVSSDRRTFINQQIISSSVFTTSGKNTKAATRTTETTTELKMSSSTGSIGFIGLGIMGEGMAARLLSEGVAGQTAAKPLYVWNRTKAKCTSLKEKFPDKFVEIKDTAKEVIECSDVTYSMLSTPEVSNIVFNDENGILAGISDGKCLVDCATLAEVDMINMNKAVTEKGGTFLEAPVSGSKGPAATGTLIFLCAGNKDLFDKVVNNGLNVMGKASHFFNNDVGYGTRAKLVVNSLMGTMMAAYSESLVLSENLNLDPSKMIEVISQGAIASPMYTLKGPKMIQSDHAPNFPLKHAHKDMKLPVEMAKDVGSEFTVIEAGEKILCNARNDEEMKLSDEDFSSVYEKVHKESTGEASKKKRKTN